MSSISSVFGGNRKTMRAVPNPLDKSTIVSIYPHEIMERKPTIEPGYFHIKPGSYDSPSILVVGPSSWWKDVDPEQPLLEIVNSSIQVADSVCRDYMNGLFMCDMATSMPGLFFVLGPKTVDQIRKDHRAELDAALAKQRNWYQNLVKAGDILWARTNGNPLSISNDMRLAAQELNLKDKPWMQDFSTITMVNCPACGSLVRPGFPVCGSCKTIVNAKLYKEMGLQQAS